MRAWLLSSPPEASAFISQRWQTSGTLQVACGGSSPSRPVPRGGARLGRGDAIPAPQLALLALGCGTQAGMPAHPVPASLHPPELPLRGPRPCKGWDPPGPRLSPLGVSLCSGTGITEGRMEALRDRSPAPNAGTRCTWHLLGKRTAASPRSGLHPAVRVPTVPSTTLLPRGVQSSRG